MTSLRDCDNKEIERLLPVQSATNQALAAKASQAHPAACRSGDQLPPRPFRPRRLAPPGALAAEPSPKANHWPAGGGPRYKTRLLAARVAEQQQQQLTQVAGEMAALEGVRHRTVEANGVRLHVAESGPEDGAAVLLLHGFPDLWYGWRHQMAALAARGYRAVAPDLRGYGDTTGAPPEAAAYTTFHVVGDLVALIADLAQPQVFVVGHDWGAMVSWQLCLLRPDLVRALVNLSVAYHPRGPERSPLQSIKAACGEDHYMCRFQKPGEAEAEFARYDIKDEFKKIFGMRKPAPLILAKDKSFFDSLDSDGTCPAWLSEEDISYYAEKFAKTGFTGGFNYYRCMDLNWELSAPWTGAPVKVPTKFIVGDLDLTYNTPGVKDYIHKGVFKAMVPNLEDVIIMEGVGHFINQEKPNEVSDHICEFFSKF